MNISIDYKEVDVLLDALALLKSKIENRRRTYEPVDLSEIEDLVQKIILSNNSNEKGSN